MPERVTTPRVIMVCGRRGTGKTKLIESVAETMGHQRLEPLDPRKLPGYEVNPRRSSRKKGARRSKINGSLIRVHLDGTWTRATRSAVLHHLTQAGWSVLLEMPAMTSINPLAPFGQSLRECGAELVFINLASTQERTALKIEKRRRRQLLRQPNRKPYGTTALDACKRHDYEKFLDEWRALGYAVHTYDNNGFHGEDIAVDPLVRDSVVHLLERLGYARAT